MTPTAERESVRPDRIYEVHLSGLDAILSRVGSYEEELEREASSVTREKFSGIRIGGELFQKLAKPKIRKVLADQLKMTDAMKTLVIELAHDLDVTLRPMPLEDGPNEGQLWGVDLSSERLEESKAVGLAEFEALFNLGYSPDNMEALLTQMKEEWEQGRSVVLRLSDD